MNSQFKCGATASGCVPDNLELSIPPAFEETAPPISIDQTATPISRLTEVSVTSTQRPTATAVATDNSTEENSPKIRVEGTARLFTSVGKPEQSQLDLDTGNVSGPEHPEADFVFNESSGGTVEGIITLETYNNQSFGIEVENISQTSAFEECYNLINEMSHTVLDFYHDYCIITNEGRLSFVETYDFGSPAIDGAWFEFRFITWDPPVLHIDQKMD